MTDGALETVLRRDRLIVAGAAAFVPRTPIRDLN
jgi:hypothetical protein